MAVSPPATLAVTWRDNAELPAKSVHTVCRPEVTHFTQTGLDVKAGKLNVGRNATKRVSTRLATCRGTLGGGEVTLQLR